MSDDSKFDIAMLFVLNGNAVYGESAMDVNPADTLMQDFQPIGDSYQFYSNFFQVKSFEFKMALKPDEGNVGSQGKPGASHPGKAPPAASATDQADVFDRWRSAKESELKDIHFPIEFDSFTFTRVIDGASPIFFQSCANQISFDSAALVKRVSTGARTGSDAASLAFLRIDFANVLLKSVTWQDGDLVTETCSFTCKQMKFQYRQQDESGALQAAGSPATWDRDRDAQITQKRS